MKYAQEMLHLKQGGDVEGDVQRCIYVDKTTSKENSHPMLDEKVVDAYAWDDMTGNVRCAQPPRRHPICMHVLSHP